LPSNGGLWFVASTDCDAADGVLYGDITFIVCCWWTVEEKTPAAKAMTSRTTYTQNQAKGKGYEKRAKPGQREGKGMRH